MDEQKGNIEFPHGIKSVLSLSYKQLLQGRLYIFIAGSIGSLMTVLTFFTKYYNWTLIDSVGIGATAILIIFLLIFLILFFQNKKRYETLKLNELINQKVDTSLKEYLSKELKENLRENVEKNFHGEAIIALSKSFSKIHWLERKLPQLEISELLDTMSDLCDELRQIFSNKNDYECSVSIKVIRKNDEGKVENFCRDSKVIGRDTLKYNTGYHIICQNLLTNTSTFYLNNNIPSSTDYMNTSIGCYNEGIIPYQSELIVPLIPLIKKEADNFPLRGFLCVDCKEKNNFDIKYDVPTLQGVADGIYELFSNILSKN